VSRSTSSSTMAYITSMFMGLSLIFVTSFFTRLP
jgi:hypothetical protein